MKKALLLPKPRKCKSMAKSPNLNPRHSLNHSPRHKLRPAPRHNRKHSHNPNLAPPPRSPSPNPNLRPFRPKPNPRSPNPNPKSPKTTNHAAGQAATGNSKNHIHNAKKRI